MPRTRFSPDGPTVMVVGPGFSADLDFPSFPSLSSALSARLPATVRRFLHDFLQRQYPLFQADEAVTYPSIEELLAKLLALEQRQYLDASGPQPTFSEPRELRRLLLSETAAWFMERQQEIVCSPPKWLQRLCDWVLRHRPTLITFNWDLVLDQLLYGDTLSAQAYGLGLPAHVPALLKPHGSLNWYDTENISNCRPDRDSFRMGLGSTDRILAYRNLERSSFPPRGPCSPSLFPEAFLRDAGSTAFREIDRACIERLSDATHVIFLGYSMPTTDLHARSIFQSGLSGRDRTPMLLAINSDASALARTSASLGRKCPVMQENAKPKDWIMGHL